MLQAIINFFKRTEQAPQAPTPYKVETPTPAQRTDQKPVAAKAAAIKPAVKKPARRPRKPQAPKSK